MLFRSLTDSRGRTVDFKNTVVVMTSNVGTGEFDPTAALRAHFRPEFLNRVDEIVTFHSLDREHLKRIIDIQIAGLMKRLAERKIHVTLSDAAKDFLVREGYDPTYGARPLKRTIQRRVLDPLALQVLEGTFGEGDTIRVDGGPDGLRFEKQETVKA